MPNHIVPTKKCRKSHHESQNFREKWKSGCFKVNEKSAKHKHLKVGFQGRKNQTNFSQAYIYTCCGPKQIHCAIEDLERHYKRWESEIVKVWVSESWFGRRDAYTQERGAHRGHNAHAACPLFSFLKGAMHTQCATHWAWHATHIARGIKQRKSFQISVKASKSRGRPCWHLSSLKLCQWFGVHKIFKWYPKSKIDHEKIIKKNEKWGWKMWW